MIEIRLYWIINWHLISWFHFIQKIHHIHRVNLFPITSSCPEVAWSVATLPEWNLRHSPSGRGAFAVCWQNEFTTKACEKWWKSVTESEVKHASSIRTSMKPFYTSFTTSAYLWGLNSPSGLRSESPHHEILKDRPVSRLKHQLTGLDKKNSSFAHLLA